MNKNQSTEQQVYIAIDIAKRSHDALISWPSGQTKMLKVPNTLVGYRSLLEATRTTAEHVVLAFEPTADYHRNIAYWFAKAGANCQLVSSLSCARAREMLFKTWDKNDRKDARVILYMMQQGLMNPFYDPLLAGYMDVQEISNTYHQISIARTRCQHSIRNHYLTLYFPEIERFLHATRSDWFCRFLLKFPTPLSITRYRKETFVKRAWDIVGRKVAKERFLQEVYEIAENSIGLPVALDSMAVVTFKLQVNRYKALTEQRAELERQADQFLGNQPDYQHLRTIPGVGPIIALIIIAESGDLRRFGHYRQYINFCGMNLSATQSGNSAGRPKLSKRGSARLRYAYWLAAVQAVQQRENSFRYKYQKYIQKDPDNRDLQRKARVAVATKIARVAHSLVKNNCPYRGYHEFGYGT